MKRYRVRPGKVPSVMSLIIGSLFVLLGVFVVIPSAGLFGVVWTAVAAVSTVTAAINVFSDKGVISSEMLVEDDRDLFLKEGAGEAPEEDEADRLKKLEDLYGQGLITYEEYQKKRKSIIDSI